NVDRILAYSKCRRCGGCCIPNPLNPGNPGVEVFEDELRRIGDHLHQPYETLKEETIEGKTVPYPYEMDKLYVTRWLPLPCPFHVKEASECRAHSVRPVVCQIHPIVFTGDNSYMAIKVNCDYGKDLIKRVFHDLRAENPEMALYL
ncbi:MAG: YkgJ family cysteine cluster protein, partial [Dehalococcoidales bacterium]